MADILELAARVEALTGPDREVDLEIHRFVDPDWMQKLAADGKRPLPWLFCYTTSLDAAVTLVPEGHYVQMAFGADYEPWATVSDPDINDGNEVILHLASGKSPAIALTAAAPRAKAGQP